MNDRIKILAEEVKNLEEIIKRMASNSLEIKKWTVALVAGVLALKVGQGASFLIAFIPLCAFWYLDAFYLRLERMFRKKYTWLIKYRLEHDDRLFDVDVEEFKTQVDSWFQIAKSQSVLPFYGGIGILLVLVAFYHWWLI
ncbi:hypothetical protein [Helicobacter cynogastricus]|uniref:hypothetical protein n=1 Tax=Helicobacter cynogastricus TaxID=329937 RepID=UPI0018F856FA|nr:hypothetical protein [Helicobacter cynogastricus]